MTEQEKILILDAWDWCDDEDKSTEFMLQYMSDVANVSYDDVVQYICSEEADDDRIKYYRNRGDEATAQVFINAKKDLDDNHLLE